MEAKRPVTPSTERRGFGPNLSFLWCGKFFSFSVMAIGDMLGKVARDLQNKDSGAHFNEQKMLIKRSRKFHIADGQII